MTRLSIAFLVFPVQLSAQDTCSCSRNLDRYVDMVTRDYSGFHDKVTSASQPRYDALVDSLKHEAASNTDKSACFKLLDTYRSFFWDKHLQLGGAFAPREDGGASDPPRTTSWTNERLQAHFGAAGSKDPITGIYQLETYQVGIVHNDSSGHYDAVIMKSGNPNWKEGMVKFTFTEPSAGRATAQYWRGDMRMRNTVAYWVSGHIALSGIGNWHMINPPDGSMNARTFDLRHGTEVQWRLLNDTTLYIKLGSCDLANKAVLDSLLAGNKKVLEDIPYWIVDFRDNGGGSTDVFQSLLPYLYTQPFKEYGVSHWLSPDNTAVLKDFLVENEKMMDAGSARSIRALVKQGEARPNTWHIGQGETTRLNKHEMPRRVAILANSGTASSGEAFLEVARGISAKSVIFGENTGGFMDYGDVMPHDLHCDGLIAAIPTSRMNRIDHGLSYDKDGIAPDVRIGPTEPDWITFVQHYWGRP